MYAKQTGGIVGLLILGMSAMALAASGTTFEGIAAPVEGSSMTLVFYLGLAGALGIVALAFGTRFSPAVIGALVVLLFVASIVASHTTWMGAVGVALGATLP